MRLRSPLFAPGDSDRKMTKAIASAADAVILDLEDSVAAPAKPTARAMVPDMVRAHPGRGLIVRVNPRGTPWYLDDLAAVVPARPAAVMLPKCRGPADLATLDHHLEALEAAAGAPIGSIGVVAIVTETAGSVFTLGGYADVASRLIAICFGAEDLSADLGISPRRADGGYPAPVVLARAQVLVAAGALGVPAIDTPYPGRPAARGRSGSCGRLCRENPDPPGADRHCERRLHPLAGARKLGGAGERRLHREPGCRRVRARRQDDRSAALEAGAADPGGGRRRNGGLGRPHPRGASRHTGVTRSWQ
jgi:citrate lyase subunit beta/citryl-CoA lyase